ncbi:DNA-methyltransferase [Chondromyces crocatus]|uniref:Methyltransferase n=1 Tax=Chondromyces crocatus TaxID=52 RepID=A0A0K1ECR7_CHOCO|nr:site-specific DNA-methyltransferase [Chondromyces crocatus]AKT38492.1 restriction endonuclease subunit M [Chondromyces crocatus]
MAIELRGEGRSPEAGDIGPYPKNRVVHGDCQMLLEKLPDGSVDLIVTSPPYWGQRISEGIGEEADPRAYLATLTRVFRTLRCKLKPKGLLWLNLGDAYNTPVNWRHEDRSYSTLGHLRQGLSPHNAAYTKPRYRRRAFLGGDPWLQYGNLLGLPYRLVLALCDEGWLLRGEVIWRKRNPLPEGRCRRPHRQHEALYLLARSEQHAFRRVPPVGSVWEFANERVEGRVHRSRFPEELPRRCIEASEASGPDTLVLDPFAGSGTTGVVARRLGCTFLGFEIDAEQVEAANERLSMHDVLAPHG